MDFLSFRSLYLQYNVAIVWGHRLLTYPHSHYIILYHSPANWWIAIFIIILYVKRRICAFTLCAGGMGLNDGLPLWSLCAEIAFRQKLQCTRICGATFLPTNGAIAQSNRAL